MLATSKNTKKIDFFYQFWAQRYEKKSNYANFVGFFAILFAYSENLLYLCTVKPNTHIIYYIMKKFLLPLIAIMAFVLSGCENNSPDMSDMYVGEWRVSIKGELPMYYKPNGEYVTTYDLSGDNLTMIINKSNGRLIIESPYGKTTGNIGNDGCLYIDVHYDNFVGSSNMKNEIIYTHGKTTKISNNKISWTTHVERTTHGKTGDFIGNCDCKNSAEKIR